MVEFFAFTIAQTKFKFSPRARRCVFLGHPFNVKGYKVFDLQFHSVFISKDVVFHESVFPYQYNSCSSSSAPSIPLPCPPSISYDNLDSNLSHSMLHSAPISSTHLDDEFLQDAPAEPPEPLVNPIPLQRFARISKQPSYLQAYHCNQVSSIPIANTLHLGTSHPLSSHLSYQFLSPSYKHFYCSISSIVKPSYYYQAVSDPKWQEAMVAEIAALKANNTWTLTPLPVNKKPICCKWVYKIKYKFDGSIERHKAKLVAKGFTQKEGNDYIETFSLVAKMVSVKCLLAMAAAKWWCLGQLDVNNAFLYGDLF